LRINLLALDIHLKTAKKNSCKSAKIIVLIEARLQSKNACSVVHFLNNMYNGLQTTLCIGQLTQKYNLIR
jgi:hypothetical protein